MSDAAAIHRSANNMFMVQAPHIGNINSEAAVLAVADALVKIMSAGADQKTLRCAIDAFGRVAKIDNTSSSNLDIDNRTVNV